MERSKIGFFSMLGVVVTQFACSHATPAAKPAAPASVAAAPAPAPAVAKAEDKEVLDVGDKSIYFDFNSRLLREEARPTLAKIAEVAKKKNAAVHIEGNCDERGTTEYNLALGEERARAAQKYLEQLGVPGHKVHIVSYGAERPKASGHDESAWAQNRRGDIRVK
jgi:peptidoglycan-associated lipoprotein